MEFKQKTIYFFLLSILFCENHVNLCLWEVDRFIAQAVAATASHLSSFTLKRIETGEHDGVQSNETYQAGLEEPHYQIHQIAITFSSKNVKNLEKVCKNVVHGASDKRLRVKRPVRMPTKVLHITTRKSACGEGTNSWDKFEPCLHRFEPHLKME